MKLCFTKKATVCQSLMSIHLWNLTVYCDESQSQHRLTAFTGEDKVMLDISSITVVQKFLFYIQKHFFFSCKNNFLGEMSPWSISETHMFWVFQNIILKSSALKCFHVEIMMEGCRIVSVPTTKFSKKHKFCSLQIQDIL